MAAKTQTDKIILGVKVRQFRQESKFSLAELAKEASLSVSYLNEIEKGKKYPKIDKLEALAAALRVSYTDLTSKELPPKLSPLLDLLQSNFLNDLPLELFGIELTKVVDIIANAPSEVSAFIATLLELARNYAVGQSSFYIAALRSYLELHNNYFKDLEEAAEAFAKRYDIPNKPPIPAAQLGALLEEEFNYTIIENGLDDYEELHTLRSVYLPKPKKLLLNSQLTERQRAFLYGKELGFNYLNLKHRATTSSLMRSNNFEEVLSHSKAIYFSVALFMNREQIILDMERFFRRKEWDGHVFIDTMMKYGASPEMFYHRLTNILPQFFGLRKLFFVRFVHNTTNDLFEIDRELHLDNRHHPHQNGLSEHYCRRWIAVSILEQLHELQEAKEDVEFVVDVQRVRYYGTKDEYLCFTMARSSYPTPNKNASSTLGLLIDDTLKQRIKFLNDPAIEIKEVNQTCERCAIKNCDERVVEPSVIYKREHKQKIVQQLRELVGKEG